MDEASDSIDALIECLDQLDQVDRKAIRRAVDALISLADTAPEVAGKLHAAMERTPAEKRWPMAYVLAQIAPLSTACMDALKNALDVGDPDIRWAVALLLVRLAKKSGSEIVTELVDLLKFGRPTQRRMAVYCLRDIGVEDPLSRQAMRDALADPEPLVRVAAVTSLKSSPENGRTALGELLRLVAADPDVRVRASAALALARVDLPNKEIREALENAARNADAKLAKAARAALEIMGRR